MMGGQNTHLPIKVNMSGVMPVIFASSIMSLPGTIRAFFNIEGEFANKLLDVFNYNGFVYALGYVVLIIMFNYFYVSMQYNPVEIANNLRQSNGAIQGIRPGKPTSDYLNKILNYIVFIGAIGLTIIAVAPIFFNGVFSANVSFAGTSIIIVVGVIIETLKQIESQMLVRYYKGFLND